MFATPGGCWKVSITCYVSVYVVINRRLKRLKHIKLPILPPKMVLYKQPMQYDGKMKHFKNKRVKQSTLRQEELVAANRAL
eukprot:scaffold7092_cov120-Cylindrotheca_fusiformis.AAC.1